MNETFKASLCAEWTVTDDGIFIKGRSYHWDEISNITSFSKASLFTNGVEQMNAGGKIFNLAYGVADKDRASAAILFAKEMLQKKAMEKSGMSQDSIAQSSISNMFDNLVVTQPELSDDLKMEAMEVIPSGEKLYIALKGAFKEYLFCTDKMVYIHKKGYMTGHTFGAGAFKMPYANITNAEVDFHLTTGYFELSSGGLQNKPLNYWDNKGNSPQHAPNAISITGDPLKVKFQEAATFIMQKVAEAHNQANGPVVQAGAEKSVADQIRDLKGLLDDGLITQDEFDAKKKQLLGI